MHAIYENIGKTLNDEVEFDIQDLSPKELQTLVDWDPKKGPSNDPIAQQMTEARKRLMNDVHDANLKLSTHAKDSSQWGPPSSSQVKILKAMARSKAPQDASLSKQIRINLAKTGL
jgi:hypothetical protein